MVAYFLEVGLLLIVAPWTGFWEDNLFVIGWPRASELLLSPWLRGALSGVGAVTLGAGLLDLLGIFLGRQTAEPPSAPIPR